MKNDISEELRALSALVASISRETPYRVPEGYFSNFSTLVAQRIGSTPRLPGNLESAKPLTFTVPDGYFEGFAGQVLNRIKAGAGPGRGTEKSTLSRGTEESAPIRGAEASEELPAILSRIGRAMPYAVPEGYFEGLSPILAVVKGENPYTVPSDYFEGLAAEINGTLAGEAQHTAKVVSMGKRSSWLKYSAAAVVAGLILTVGGLRLFTSTTNHTAATPGNGQNPVEIAKTLSKVSDEELQNFLVDQDTTLAQPVLNNAAMATLDMNDADLKNLLGDIPDGELKQYMEEHGGATDIATN